MSQRRPNWIDKTAAAMLGRTERKIKYLTLLKGAEGNQRKQSRGLVNIQVSQFPVENLKNDVHKGRFCLTLYRTSISMHILKGETKARSD